MKVLVTGVAGFIGMHVALDLLLRGDLIVGVDNLNDYYDPQLKRDRLKQLRGYANFRFVQGNIENRELMAELFQVEQFERVVHLAAQAGVRYSITNPHAYVESNLVGFINVLEGCRHNQVQHLIYASSSSVYGSQPDLPFREDDNVAQPMSLYAATKKANELMAHSYSHLFGLPTTGLRFFTVYGPWGRPDMAYFLFTKAILEGGSIDVFNHGNMQRDLTYIGDIVESVVRVLDRSATPMPGSTVPYRIFNIGNHTPVQLLDFIMHLEDHLGVSAIKCFKPMQDGDVPITYADSTALAEWIDFRPHTSFADGSLQFVNWYKSYYRTHDQATLNHSDLQLTTS